MKICHITSMHDWDDDRIFQRACVGLAREGHEVTLIATFDGSDIIDDVKIVGIQPRKNFRRRIFSSSEALIKAYNTDADIYHFHDPDLLPWMLMLKLTGKRIVYDIHENYVVRFFQWNMPKPLRGILANLFSYFENAVIRRIDGVVATSISMADIYKNAPKNKVIVRNMHDIERLKKVDTNVEKDTFPVIYTSGTNGPNRNCKQMIDALPLILDKIPNVIMRVAGNFPSGYMSFLKQYAAELGVEKHYELLGYKPYFEHFQRTLKVHIGCVFLKNDFNCINTTSNRLFEYMYCGLPILAENLPEPRRVIEDTGCGLLVDSTSPESIAEGALYLLNNPEEMAEMGRRGREAVLTKYNFNMDLKGLIRFYKEIIG